MLHTPTAQEPGITTERLVTKDGQPAKIGERAYDKDTGRLAQVGLSQQVQMMQPFLKTPCTADSYTDKMKSKGVSGTSGTLAQEVVSGYAAEHRGLLLPTPTAIEGVKWTNTWNPNSQMGQSLSAMAGSGMLPTPTTCTYKQASLSTDAVEKTVRDGRQETVAIRVFKVAKATGAVKDGETSRLSPLVTEEMMGFPLMWTALPFLSESGAPKPSKPTATPSSPK